jgi:hypothetical protein
MLPVPRPTFTGLGPLIAALIRGLSEQRGPSGHQILWPAFRSRGVAAWPGLSSRMVAPCHALRARVGVRGGENRAYDLAQREELLAPWLSRGRRVRPNKAMKLTTGGLVWSDVESRLLRTVLSSASGPRRSRPSQLIAGVRRT